MDHATHMMGNALALSIGMLIHELDVNNAIPKDDFLESLRRTADNIEANPGPRLDALSAAMLRRIVKIVELGPNQTSASWEPVLIQGGKSGPDDLEGCD